MNEKEILIKELINSGINITPSTLDFLLNLKEPLKSVKSIIKSISFLPNFNGHLTEEILQKISKEEMHRDLKNVLLKKIDQTSIKKNVINEDYNNQISNLSKPIKNEKHKTKIFENSAKISLRENLDQNNVTIQNYYKDSGKTVMKSKLKETSFERSRSTLGFKPIAKDYDINFEILQDPTGKLYTNGDYDDFYNLTLDKFNKLRYLMRKRPEVHSANNINNILRLSSKVEVSVMGFVNEIRKTKNGNFFLVLEDLTNFINVIIRNDSENQENVKIAERTLSDQMVYVEGTYNPGEKSKSGIIYCNYISTIDIPRDYEPHKSPDPISIALISDTHIGSREFEEKLWNRFIAFLHGKIGNKTQKELAGRIKYIIINGDLVDGIGVYPTQKDDLLISDIYKQFNKATEILSRVPEYIKIFYSSGNHEPVRNAIPRPAVPKKYSTELINIGVSCIGNPSLIQTHNVNTLVFHGDSILDLNMLVPGLENNNPVDTMIELLKCRHLAPIYGKKTQIAPTNKDWLVIGKIPDIFHTGHIHINGMGYYNNIALVNSGCFQSQTEFMNSLGIHPTPGILSIIDLDTLKATSLDLKNSD
ncbi:MAG: metallophosphoesterase [Promethearchaeota archaeon]|nr:MAG: metallophosphoesterase [Candidatus Lokiarchaeota archaeon]